MYYIDSYKSWPCSPDPGLKLVIIECTAYVHISLGKNQNSQTNVSSGSCTLTHAQDILLSKTSAAKGTRQMSESPESKWSLWKLGHDSEISPGMSGDLAKAFLNLSWLHNAGLSS